MGTKTAYQPTRTVKNVKWTDIFGLAGQYSLHCINKVAVTSFCTFYNSNTVATVNAIAPLNFGKINRIQIVSLLELGKMMAAIFCAKPGCSFG